MGYGEYGVYGGGVRGGGVPGERAVLGEGVLSARLRARARALIRLPPDPRKWENSRGGGD